MRDSIVILEINASRLELAFQGPGGERVAQGVRFDRSQWPTPWTSALPEIRAAAQSLVRGAGVQGRRCRVVCSVPGVRAVVSGCPKSLSSEQAERSALLAMTASTEAPDEPAADVATLYVDAHGANPRRHLIACIASEQDLDLLAGVAEGAGLTLDEIVPGEVNSVALAVATAVDTDGINAVLVLEDDHAVLAVGEPGRVILIRSMALGVDSFAEALTRPMRGFSAESSVTLTREQARHVFEAAGLPKPEDPIPGRDDLRGASLLPLLQPLLQRLSLELRQSLRYSGQSASTDGVRLRVLGRGAGIPNFESALAGAASLSPAGESTVAGGLTERARGLIPRATRELRRGRRFRAMLAAGTCLAVTLGAYEWIDATKRERATEQEIARITGTDPATMEDARIASAALSAREAVARTEARAAKVLGDQADPAVALAAIAGVKPPSVRLTFAEMQLTQDGPGLALRGVVMTGDASESATTIAEFIESMGRLPIVSRVRLGSTQRTTLREHAVQNFEITVNLVPLPAFSLGPETTP